MRREPDTEWCSNRSVIRTKTLRSAEKSSDLHEIFESVRPFVPCSLSSFKQEGAAKRYPAVVQWFVLSFSTDSPKRSFEKSSRRRSSVASLIGADQFFSIAT